MEEAQQRSLLEYGWLCLNRDDVDAAEDAATRVLAAENDHEEALLLLGFASIRLKKPAQAEHASRRLLEVAPNHAASHLLLGFFFSDDSQKDPVAAEQAFREAVSLDPDSADNYAFLGQFLGMRNRLREGIVVARKGLKIDPDNPLVVHTLQCLYRLSKDAEMAENFGAHALSLAPEESANHLEAGLRWLSDDHTGKAKGSFREALRLAPADADSQAAIAHEKVRQHKFFKKGFFISFDRITIIGACLTVAFWWGLSLLWHPFIYMAGLSIVIAIGAFGYHGLFLLCRRLTLRRLRNGRL